MSGSGDIKIRTLPRSNEKKPEAPASNGRPVWILAAGLGICALLLTLTLLPKTKPTPKVNTARSTSSVPPKVENAVTKHMNDLELKAQMMRLTREIENSKVAPLSAETPYLPELPDNRTFGVHLDSDNMAERLYEELNDDRPVAMEMSPEDRISARLANRKWMNEMERAERIRFVGDFIRSAYERGYEVQLDNNLVVVGVKPVNPAKKVNIEQVMEQLARQGQ